jgi:hypothetical protein
MKRRPAASTDSPARQASLPHAGAGHDPPAAYHSTMAYKWTVRRPSQIVPPPLAGGCRNAPLYTWTTLATEPRFRSHGCRTRASKTGTPEDAVRVRIGSRLSKERAHPVTQGDALSFYARPRVSRPANRLRQRPGASCLRCVRRISPRLEASSALRASRSRSACRSE